LSSSIIDHLRTARRQVWQLANDTAQAAAQANRGLTPDEQADYERYQRELDAYDARIASAIGTEQRAKDADDAFNKLNGGRVEYRGGPPQRPLSDVDQDLDRAFRSAIKARNPSPIDIPVSGRSYYQPGLETRATLKSTATQAMPVSVYDQIVAHMVENSAILKAGATVLNTATGEDLQVPKSTAFSTSAAVAEGGLIGDSDPTLGVVTLKAWKYGAYFEVSHELANDTSVDLLGFLARQAGESLALAYGNKLINGVGTTEPRGVLLDAPAGQTGPAGTGTSLGTQGTVGHGTDALYNLAGSLAEPYANRATAWLMRNASLTIIRKLRDTTGQPVVGNDGRSFLGVPFVLDPFMPAMANAAESIAFGDFSRYFVRIAEGIRFERSDEFRFQNDLVAFRALIRIDGALVDINAVKTFVNQT
jgi:HK97 family phage major capsid protein